MQEKSSRVLYSLIATGLVFASVPAQAVKTGTRQTDNCRNFIAKILKEDRRRYGAKGYHYYCILLMEAVTKNVEQGKITAADEAFRHAVRLAKSDGVAKYVLPDMYRFYAKSIAQHIDKDDQESTEYKAQIQIMQDLLISGLKYARKNPSASRTRLNYSVDMINCYDKTGLNDEARSHVIVLDENLKSLERRQKPRTLDLIALAETLIKLSNFVCPGPIYPYALQAGNEEIAIVTSLCDVNNEKFKIAETYQLRAMAQYNKLDANDRSRIEAQRNLARWYHLYGQTEKEETQIQKLGQLLHTTDRVKLFPPRRNCNFCGMG